MDKTKIYSTDKVCIAFLMCFILAQTAFSQEAVESPSTQNADLAQELTNPLADLVTIPIQVNYDYDIGPEDEGEKIQTNIQPVIPFHLTDDWNLISRTIMPVTYQDNVFPDSGSQFGLGDISMSLFFSPKEPGSSGVIWGGRTNHAFSNGH